MIEVLATIITIGDELLIGQVIDTNSAWLAQQLNSIGIIVKRRVAVGDSYGDIVAALEVESGKSQFVLLTGGLGPTNDDITKNVLCEYFGGRMMVNDQALAHVKHLFEKVFRRPISDVNLRQAEVPDVCEVIQNARGSAPGMIFKKDGTIFISMPGVPYEMKGMVTDHVLPLLQRSFTLPKINHRYILTAGIGESALAEEIKDLESSLPADIKLAYLPNYGMVRLRLSTYNEHSAIDDAYQQLKRLVSKYMVTDNDDTLPVVVGKLLTAAGDTLATAESCTGGNIAHLITANPGASVYFKGSVVSYSNDLKASMLDVSHETLHAHGAVSEETVREMLSGLLKVTGATYGIATSGIMGPDGGSAEKPVGTVWVAAGNRGLQLATKLQLRFSRERNIEVASMMALNFLRKFIVENGT